ncbi:hypothetical protein LPB86_01680 [Pedobacter sp. MC2016-14]|uniref:asparagine synthetase B family protein n=1 Tax=Pedobacter sp. MC2016-14 TaxID=2897327 RepID=UPI001E4FBAE9|nr:asparagine synthase-related protein [Pedobacter sp. MC2016-14]MCD0486919.1 hypothetical protein [Pedobacter sp. MC2016-14]
MGSIAGYTGFTFGFIDKMLESLQHWTPDRKDIYKDENVCMGSLELFNTSESYINAQPLKYGQTILVANCRIDNREELATQFNISHKDSIADIKYIALAYEKWGCECVKYLYGDFAFVLWDKETQKLFGARDHVGIKTLYYTKVEDEFIFSSEIKGILGHQQVKPILNDAYFVYAFSAVSLPVTETPYNNIHQLPSGSYFEWQNHKLNITKYWELGKKEIEIPDHPEQQFEHFEKLLYKSVSTRLRTSGKIGAELSGGLDSTGIAAIAMKILGEGAEFYTYCFGKSDQDITGKDDSHLAAKFCEQYHISKYFSAVNERNLTLKMLLNLKTSVYDDDENNGVPQSALAFLPDARDKNVRVVLSGHGGDQLVTSRSTHFYLGASRRRHYKILWKGLRDRFGILQGVLRFVYYLIRGIDGNRFLRQNININRKRLQLEGIDKGWIKKYDLWDIPSDRYALHSQSNRQQRYIECISYASLQHRAWHHDLTGLHFNIEYRFPLLDVRLLDYIMRLPENTVAPKNQERFLFTKAVKNIIPEEITAIKKSKTSSVPFTRYFNNLYREDVTTQTGKAIQEGSFSKYFTLKRLAEIKNKGNLSFLSLALLYNKINKMNSKY